MRTRQSIINYIYRKEDIDKFDSKFKLFGAAQKFNTEAFLKIRLFTSSSIFVLVFLFANNTFIVAPLITLLYYYGMTYLMVDKPLKERAKTLEREAFYYFEVLTLSLESGRNLEMAIETACTYIKSGISQEFKETLYQVKFGKSLSEALDDMRMRIPSEIVNNIITNVMQSSLFGNSILNTMYNQLDYLRDKQIMEVKAEISKIPTKISIFSVIFFVPLILMLIIAPLVIDYITNL
ncbi:MAG: type II secretion system F family protein [Bacilli bacterium]|nr:type II secretion system F family protein [Bacilli bacterium]